MHPLPRGNLPKSNHALSVVSEMRGRSGGPRGAREKMQAIFEQGGVIFGEVWSDLVP